MIQCIGGFQVIIPLLEKISKETKYDDDDDLYEVDSGKGNVTFMISATRSINIRRWRVDYLATRTAYAYSAYIMIIYNDMKMHIFNGVQSKYNNMVL